MPLQATSRTAGAEAPFAAFVLDEATLQSVRQAAERLGWPGAGARLGGVADAMVALQAGSAPQVLLVDVSAEADPAAAMDALADVCDPQTRVLALGAQNDVSLYRRLVQMGVSDYLAKPVAPAMLCEALELVRRSEAPAAPQPSPVRSCRTLALIGARGGAGATTVATSVAWSLANEHRLQTVLLDLDLQFGSVSMEFDLEPGRGLIEILSSPERIDSLLIGSASHRHGENLRVLSAEEPLGSEIRLGDEGLLALTSLLRTDSDVIVIDLPRRQDRLTLSALANADVVGVVTDLTLAGLRDTQRLMRTLATLRPGRDTLAIANRVGGAPAEAPQSEFERSAGTKLAALVPFDTKAAKAAAEQGKPLLAAGGDGPAATALRGVAGLLTGEAAPPKAASSWIERLLGR